MDYFADIFEVRANSPITIVTEATADNVFYQKLFDRYSREGIIFILPNFGSEIRGQVGGYRSARVTRDRMRSEGTRVWCLLDGEESLRYGRGRELFEEPNLIFTLDDPEAAGCLFLNCYELENLYLRYGTASQMIASRIESDRGATDKKEQFLKRSRCIEAALRTSVLKMAAKSVLYNRRRLGSSYIPSRHDDEILKLIEKVPVHDDGTKRMVQRVLNYWVAGPLRDLFYAEIDSITGILGFELLSNVDTDWANERWMSLCDGKAAVRLGLTQDYGRVIKDIQNQMLDSDFASVFRAALLKAITGKSIARNSEPMGSDSDASEVLQLRIHRSLKF